jgi:hypothetical protein
LRRRRRRERLQKSPRPQHGSRCRPTDSRVAGKRFFGGTVLCVGNQKPAATPTNPMPTESVQRFDKLRKE